MDAADKERFKTLANQRLLQRAQDADRLEERLRRLEWSSQRLLPDDRPWWRRLLRPQPFGNCCPVCEQTAHYGHAPDCWLGEELHGRRPSRGH